MNARQTFGMIADVLANARTLDRQLGELVPGPLPLVDRFTIGHGMVGFLLGLASVPWWATLGAAVLWDVVENPLKRALPKVFPDSRPDTLPHVAIDVAAWMAGYGIARLLPPGPTPDIFKAGA